MEYIIAPIFFFVAMILMLAALKFSKYKERNSGCCGGGQCETKGSNDNIEHKKCANHDKIHAH